MTDCFILLGKKTSKQYIKIISETVKLRAHIIFRKATSEFMRQFFLTVHNTRFEMSIQFPPSFAAAFCCYPSSTLFVLVILNHMQPEAQAFGFQSWQPPLCSQSSQWYNEMLHMMLLSRSGFSAARQECCPCSSSCSRNRQEFQINIF